MLNKKLSKITAAEIETLKIKHPSIYSAIIIGRKYRPECSADTVCAITQFIELEGGHVEKIKRSDLMIVINGHFIRVYCVSFKYEATKANAEYSKAIEAAGGYYLIAVSFKFFYDWYLSKFECDE